MSLFESSIPERRNSDLGILSTIPSEIYLHIFEYIGPPHGRLTSEELEIFTNLSCVCRLFANVCLPRIFEHVELAPPGWMPMGFRTILMALCKSALSTEIVAKQHLAHTLSKMVQVCHFTGCQLDWSIQLIPHMTNVRELKFSTSSVDIEHWNAIATLGALEELSFDGCTFLRGPIHVEPEKRVKIKVPRLRAIGCSRRIHLIMSIDAQHLRSLAIDDVLIERVDWLRQLSLRELHLFRRRSSYSIFDWALAVQDERNILLHAPQSLEVLELLVDISERMVPGAVRGISKIGLPFLRSLALQFCSDCLPPAIILSSTLEAVGLLPSLQSLTLEDLSTPEISPTEIQRILHDTLGPASNLKYVDTYETAFRLVDGEWSEVSSRTTNKQ